MAKQRKAEERHASAALRRMDAMTARSKPMSIRAAAFSVMPKAYAKASGNGAWWAEARQIFYAARPAILRLAEVDKVDSGRFTQEFLVDYMSDHPDECATWKVAFDDRGHLVEPHTGREIGLGTLAVQNYVSGYAKPELIEGGYAGPQDFNARPRRALRRPALHRKGRLRPASGSGSDRQAVRSGDHELQGHERHGGARACRQDLRALQNPALHPARLRHQRLRDREHAAQVESPVSSSQLSGKDSRSSTSAFRLDDVERLGLQSEPVTFARRPGCVARAAEDQRSDGSARSNSC